MHLLDEFIKAYERGFLWSNFYLNLDMLIKKCYAKELSMQKQGRNYIFYQQTPHLLWYFADEKFEAQKGFYVKVLSKSGAFLQKQREFLQECGFVDLAKFKEMKKSAQSAMVSNTEFPNTLHDINSLANELYAFLSRFFSPKFLLFYDEKALRDKLTHNEAFVLLKDGQIQGALVFSTKLNSAMLDFIAVDENLKDKYSALTLLNAFFKANNKANFFKLFVKTDNHKAIEFYLKNGFEFSQTQLQFYKAVR